MPELDGKEYEYTDEGIEQYEEDKERLGKATGGGTNIKSIISNLLPSLYGKNTKVEKKGALNQAESVLKHQIKCENAYNILFNKNPPPPHF